MCVCSLCVFSVQMKARCRVVTQAAVAVCSAFHSSIVQVRICGGSKPEGSSRTTDSRGSVYSQSEAHPLRHPVEPSGMCVSCGSISHRSRFVKGFTPLFAPPDNRQYSLAVSASKSKTLRRLLCPQKGGKALVSRKQGSGKELIPEEATSV